MPLFLRLAGRNLARHPWRTTATILGVALGIAAVLATQSVGDNFEANIRSTLEAAAGKAALLVTPGAQGRAVFDIEPTLELETSDPKVADSRWIAVGGTLRFSTGFGEARFKKVNMMIGSSEIASDMTGPMLDDRSGPWG